MNTVGFDTSALDASFKAHAQRGIGRYVRELARYFASKNESTIEIKSFDYRLLEGNRLIEKCISALPLGRQTVRQQCVYPFTLAGRATKEFDILHFPAHMDAPSWSIKPYILTVLDLIPLVCRDLYASDSPNWRFRFGRWLELSAIRNANLIIAISENTARDVERLLHIPRERIVVTPLGVDDKFFATSPNPGGEVSRRFSLPSDRKRILYVGGIDPRKNWKMLLEVQSRLIARSQNDGTVPPLLILAGRVSEDKEFPKLQAEIGKRGLKDHVYLTGYLDEEELLVLYSTSDIFFFPSIYEGFGLTPLEALAAGLPVVSSNTSAMPEVLGDCAELVDPLDADACVLAVQKCLATSTGSEERLKKARAHARTFTWERTGEETLRAYERVLSQLGKGRLAA